MRIVDFVLGRPDHYGLRRKHDHLKSRIDTIPSVDDRIKILNRLNAVEPHIISLEQELIPDFERKSVVRKTAEEMKRLNDMFRSMKNP